MHPRFQLHSPSPHAQRRDARDIHEYRCGTVQMANRRGAGKELYPAVDAGWRVHRAILSGATAPLSSVSHSYATPMPAHIPR